MINPLKDYRLAHQLTQVQLASSLGITPQIIVSVEAGMMNTLPLRIYEAFPPHLRDLSELRYQSFRLEQRQLNSHHFVSPEALSSPTFTKYRLVVSPSHRGFCKLLCFQPSILSSFESKGQSKELLSSALSDANVPDIHIRRLVFNESLNPD